MSIQYHGRKILIGAKKKNNGIFKRQDSKAAHTDTTNCFTGDPASGLCKYINGLEFAGRKGLALALRDDFWTFKRVYLDTSHLGMTDEAWRRERGVLDRYCDGGESFKTKLREAFDNADDWQDGPAVPVDLLPTVSEVEQYQKKLRQVRSPTSYNSLNKRCEEDINPNTEVGSGPSRPTRRRRVV